MPQGSNALWKGLTQTGKGLMTIAPIALKWMRSDVTHAPGASSAEVKHLDIADSASATTSSAINILSAIPVGDTNVARDGQQCLCKGFMMNITLVQHASATTSRFRHVIFLDTRTAAATPTSANVLDLATTCVGHINVDAEPGRFVILYDKITTLCTNGDSRVVNHHIEIPALNGLPLSFNGTGGSTSASCVGPHLFQIIFSSEATNGVSFAYNSRLFFEDV